VAAGSTFYVTVLESLLLPVQVECSYFGMMPFHFVEHKVVWIGFDVLGNPVTRSIDSQH